MSEGWKSWWNRVDSRRLFAWVVIALVAAEAVGKQMVSLVSGDFALRSGDWLINYGGGFVRRGLFGQLLLMTGLKGNMLLGLILALQVACYCTILAYVVGFLRKSEFKWWAISLALGPGAFIFMGTYTDGGLRKEMLVFVALCLLGWSRRAKGVRSAGWLAGAAVLLYAVAVLTWEPSAFAAPILLLAIRNSTESPLDTARRTWVAIALAVIAVVGCMLSLMFQGNVSTLASIKDAIANAGIDPGLVARSGAGWIGVSLGGFWSAVGGYFPNYMNYLPLFILSVLPLALTPWFRRNRWWVLGCLAATLPLYLIAVDYGRYMNLAIFGLCIVAMSADSHELESGYWNPLSAMLYVTVWGIPHFVSPDVAQWPWVGVLASIGRNVAWVVGLATRMLR